MNLDPSVMATPSMRRTAAPGPARRILVAEDDNETRDLVVTAFVHDGHDVYGLDGETALTECLDMISRYSLRAPDLIAVGAEAWHSGLDLLDGIRNAGWSTPVILMTWALPRDVRQGVLRAAPAALVGKPFNTTELRSAARRACMQESGPGLARAGQSYPMARWSPPASGA